MSQAGPASARAPTQPTPPAPRRFFPVLARTVVSGGLLGFLAWKVPLGTVWPALAQFPKSGLVLCLLVTIAQLLVGVLRWHRLLRRTGEDVRYRELLFDHLVASAYNMVLPSAMGGDVIRAYRGGRRLRQPHHAWATTLLERVVGVMCLALIALPGIAVVPGAEPLRLPSVGLVALGVLVLVAAKAPLRFVSKIALSRAPKLAALTEGVAADLEGPLGTAAARGEAFGWTLLYQALGLSILAAVVAPTGDRALIAAIYTGLPLIVIASMLPVSIAGLGLRESLFVLVLGRLGVTQPIALALALVWLATYVFLAVLGVICALLTPTPIPPSANERDSLPA